MRAAAQAWNVFDFVLILVGALALYAESPSTRALSVPRTTPREYSEYPSARSRCAPKARRPILAPPLVCPGVPKRSNVGRPLVVVRSHGPVECTPRAVRARRFDSPPSTRGVLREY